MPWALRRIETFCARPLIGCTPATGGRVSWVLWSWQPARLNALATAAATPNRGRKCERAGEAMAKLLRGGSVSKGATLVSAVKRRKQELRLIFRSLVSSAVALLEFLLAAAWAWIVAANVLQGVAHRLLVSVAAVRAVDMAVVVIMVIVIVIVVAVRTMDMGLLSHRCRSGIKSPGIISPLWSTRTSLPMNNPVFSSPSSR